MVRVEIQFPSFQSDNVKVNEQRKIWNEVQHTKSYSLTYCGFDGSSTIV